MRHAVRLAVVLLFIATPVHAHLPIPRPFVLTRVNNKLHGCVHDYTHNHGPDNRLYSAALCDKRDMYVYVPPGYDCNKRYPLIIWLHGFAQDESSFLNDVVPHLDRAMACGQLAPAIVVAPDGSFKGRTTHVMSAGSFFLNTPAGRYEDYLMGEVWDFVMQAYPILPEPEAHVIAGVSMGAGAAYNKAIKYPERFKSVLGVFPPLNVRWEDCHGRYMRPFDPDCWGWREDFSRNLEVVGRFYGVITIRQGTLINPLYGRRNPNTAALIASENPIEMLDTYGVKEGRLAMYIAYGGKDQFNIAAQVESFLYRCRERGLTVQVGYEPNGRHDRATATKLMPGALSFLADRLAAYR